MQRLAFSTIPCDGWSLDEIVTIAKQSGYHGLELREGETWCVNTQLTHDERRAVLERVKKADLRITDIGSGVCFTGSEDDAGQFEKFKKVVLLSHDLEAGGVRIFLGYFANRRDQQVPAIPYANLVEQLRQACDYAMSWDVQVWIETHNEFATGRTLRKLLDDVERPNCRVIYDVIHPLEEGEEPAETIALLGPQCVHVHIKDGVPYEDQMESNWRYTRVGAGQIPIASIVGLLEESGYTGYYSLEWERKWRKELQVPGMEPDVVFPHYATFMHDIFQSIMKRGTAR
ncbi:hypothetical protein BC351_24980 [Paenibacillus ferrarius]|uniref:Xylose isomerase-like TIM barrel domain-containing protein n=1 Tax=Paenibacillus ferrarius TaxID=1469647 RepID=A0A1V4HJZ6_9BACL|nr:sugar phosphate isomerase/epimerase [Paenibacillus ferrarius]OPH57127.1 hypothetical protein BC351_24980 [Paenibacillus ferrarius]